MEPLDTSQIKRDLKVTEKANTEIRDGLATVRTQLANERTFLAYFRTAMGLVVAGFSLIQFFKHQVFIWVGVLLIPLGFFVSIVGLKKFLQRRERIAIRKKAYVPTSYAHAQVIAEEEKRSSEKT